MIHSLRDRLFKLRVYRGIIVRSPPDLVICKLIYPASVLSRIYLLELNWDHPLAPWLDECYGPWKMRLMKPYEYLRTAVAFSRTADALSFRMLSTEYYL